MRMRSNFDTGNSFVPCQGAEPGIFGKILLRVLGCKQAPRKDSQVMQNRSGTDRNPPLTSQAAAKAAPPTGRTVRRKLLTVLSSLLLCCLAVELFLGAYHWLKTGEIIWTRWSEPASEPQERFATTMVLSPFFGYTMRQGWYWPPTPEWLR